MLYALMGRKLVRADEVGLLKEIFHCPGCGAEVRLRHGEINVAHFAHANKQCAYESEAESNEHLLGKMQLYKLASQLGPAQVEVIFQDSKQRADVVLTYREHKFILEYQCSPISTVQVRQRTQAYQALGYEVIWLLGPKYQRTKISKQLIAKFKGHYLVFYSSHTQKCYLQYNFNEVDFQTIRWAHRKYELANLLQGIANYQRHIFWQDIEISNTRLVHQSFKVQQQIIRQNPEWLLIQQKCYQQGRNLGGVPWLCHPKKSMPMGLRIPHILWRCRCVLFLERQPLQSKFLINELQREFINEGRWLDVDERLIKYIVNQFIIELVLNQVLVSQKKGVLTLICYPQWYSDWQVKTNSLKLN